MESMVLDLNDPSHPGHSNHLISVGNRKVSRVWQHETPLIDSVKQRLIDLASIHVIEQCGLIDAKQYIHRITNMHTEPKHNFYFDQVEFENSINHIYDTIQTKVLGVWHTHPNGVTWPSPRDIVGWPNPDLNWRYFIATPNEVTEWRLHT